MKKLYALLLFIIFGILSSTAQTLDETFIQPTPYKAAKITTIKELSDGKILLGGHIQFFKDKKVSNLIRLNADYSLDETFVFNGDPKLEIKDVKFQSNGNIIVLSTKDNFGYADYFTLYQLDANGGIIKEVSTIFNATAIAVQADDKIVVTGGAIGYYSFTSCYLNRFNSDFSLDETFNNALSFNASTATVLVSNEGSIYVGGAFTAIDGIAKNSLVKLTSAGEIDETFDVGKGSNGSGFSMTLQDDGKLLIGGNFFNMKDNVTSLSVIRLNLDGTLDSSFSSTQYSYGNSAIVLRDSHIYVATPLILDNAMNDYLVRLSSDGELDQSFKPIKLWDGGAYSFTSNFIGDKLFHNNAGYSDSRYGLSISDLDGNIVDSSTIKPAIEGSFDTGGYINGKLFIKGDFVKINNVESFGIGLLDENGTPDESFVFSNYKGLVNNFQILNDNSIFVSTRSSFLNLNSSGEVIKDFNFKLDSDLLAIEQFKVLDNGKIFITDQWSLLLLNKDGVQETKYVLNSDPNSWITNLRFATQNDKIICSGQFEIYGGGHPPKSKLMRFNLDGTIDTNFKSNLETDSAIGLIKILDSDEIIVFGTFLKFDGVSTPNQFVKLSKDGEIDVKFNENLNIPKVGISGGEYYDYRKVEELDSVLYITQVPKKVTAINLDGTTKTDFEMPAVLDNITDLVRVVETEESSPTSRKSKSAANTDNYMFAIGSVNSNSGSSATIVKLNLGKSSGSLSVGPTPEKLASNVEVFPVPVEEKVTLSFSGSVVPNKIAVYSVSGKELYAAKVQSTDHLEVDMSQFASGVYFIKLFSDSGVVTKKIVKK